MPIIGLTLVPALLQWPVLLLPVHIVLLELLIDPACSIVFEAEPEARDLMERTPRPVSDSPFAGTALGYAVLQGLGVAGVLLLGYAWLIAHAWSALQSRSVVFVALVLSVMLLIVANRDRTRSALRGVLLPNPWLARMALAMGLLLLAVLGVPWLRTTMGLAPPEPAGLMAGLAMLAASSVWLELLRRCGQYLARRGRP
ncbi:MAG: cation-translocating P-type ATPase [Rhodoferax sp.]